MNTAAALVLILGLAACGGGDDTEPDTTADPVTVACIGIRRTINAIEAADPIDRINVIADIPTDEYLEGVNSTELRAECGEDADRLVELYDEVLGR